MLVKNVNFDVMTTTNLMNTYSSTQKRKKKMTTKNEVLDPTKNTPTDMIMLAVQQGSDLGKLETLLNIKERWEANEARKAYHQAMSDFKANPPKINKDKKVGYSTNNGKVGYSHASLYNVTEKINKELSKYGLSASWTTKQEAGITVTCKITHSKGHSEQTSLTAAPDATGSKNSIQAIGSTITYLERYSLLALTGLATFEQDNDGQDIVTEFINDKELNQVLDMIADSGADLKKVLSYLKIETLEKMPKSRFQETIIGLQKRKDKVAK